MYLFELAADDLCGPVPKRSVASSSRPAASPQMPLHMLSVFPQRVVLIDGRMLAELMVKHNIGGQDQETRVIKRIDEDFFEEVD
jgi:hypothetical protein